MKSNIAFSICKRITFGITCFTKGVSFHNNPHLFKLVAAKESGPCREINRPVHCSVRGDLRLPRLEDQNISSLLCVILHSNTLLLWCQNWFITSVSTNLHFLSIQVKGQSSKKHAPLIILKIVASGIFPSNRRIPMTIVN